MLARYREVVETVLQPAFRESKEKLIRHAVIRLIPLLAAFAPERFAASYLRICLDHLLNCLRFALRFPTQNSHPCLAEPQPWTLGLWRASCD